MFALILIGPPGAGKSSVLEALSDALVDDDVPHAMLEAEAVTATHPPLDDDRWFSLVHAVCRLHREHGQRLLLVSATVEGAADLHALLDAVGADEQSVVRLEAEPATLQQRIVAREPDGWSGLDELLAAAARLAPLVAGLDGIALALSTDGQRPEDVAASIRDAFPAVLRHARKPAEELTGDPPWLRPDAPLARRVTEVIRSGDAATLERLLDERPELARARIGDPEHGQSRTLLHVVCDWPGNVPVAAGKIRALITAGADANARFTGPHTETPLHWAASSDDVAALDALLDAGADIEAGGAVIGGGTPMADAVAFGQWSAARRLLERGARTNLWQAAALGLLDRVHDEFARTPPPAREERDNALWCAAHGGQRDAAELLLQHGADPSWVGHDQLTAAAAAERSGARELAAWLRTQADERPRT